MENYFNLSDNSDNVEEAWKSIKSEKNNIFHYVCNANGEILADDMRIFNIQYTVAAELRSAKVKDKKIEEVIGMLKNLTPEVHVFFLSWRKQMFIWLHPSWKAETASCFLVTAPAR